MMIFGKKDIRVGGFVIVLCCAVLCVFDMYKRPILFLSTIKLDLDLDLDLKVEVIHQSEKKKPHLPTQEAEINPSLYIHLLFTLYSFPPSQAYVVLSCVV
jgi:hypothetical protein